MEAGLMWDEALVLGGRSFRSRLIVGTGKYPSFPVMRRCHEASGTEMVTVAVRRIDLSGQGESLLEYIFRCRITLLPNTAGCFTADEAVRTAYLAREAGPGQSARGDRGEKTLFPASRA
jgi:thiazole synthase